MWNNPITFQKMEKVNKKGGGERWMDQEKQTLKYIIIHLIPHFGGD